MRICQTAGTRASRCAIVAICVAAGLASHGAASIASARESSPLPVRWAAAPGSYITEIQVADVHTAGSDCVKKYRWKPKLRRACLGEVASPPVVSVEEAKSLARTLAGQSLDVPPRSLVGLYPLPASFDELGRPPACVRPSQPHTPERLEALAEAFPCGD